LSSDPGSITLYDVYGAGTILAGKYRIERMIGEGGMGMVVAAMHLHLGTQVALKFLHHDMVANQQMSERFLREARASALLKSEHVCRVSDVGMLDNGAPYIVMELLTGQDLASMLRNHGPMPIATLSEYVLQALHGLAEAHGAGIVHRDLKPGNLFWTQRPDGSTLIKVLDFGIAKAPGSANFSMTQTSTVMGSPGYMSPEQLKSSKVVDARSDIWSMGVVMYELLSGRTPFEGESITELALKVAMDPTPVLPGNFPPAFQAVISRCLEKDPARRFQDVSELAQALAPFAGPRGHDFANNVTRVLRGHNAVPPTVHMVGGVGTNPPSYGTHPPAPSTPTTLGAATGAVMGGPSRSRGALIGGVVGLSIIGVVIGVVLATRGNDSKPSAAPAKEPVAAPSDPPKTDPPKTDPPKTDPVKVDPPKTDPVKVDPPKTDPAVANTPPADAGVASTPPPPADAAVATKTKTDVAVTTPPDKKDPPKKKIVKKKPEDVGDSRK
jgi:serine/threonine protein kinase